MAAKERKELKKNQCRDISVFFALFRGEFSTFVRWIYRIFSGRSAGVAEASAPPVLISPRSYSYQINLISVVLTPALFVRSRHKATKRAVSAYNYSLWLRDSV